MITTSGNKHCLVRITAADLEKLERLIFQRYPNREWGTFFRFGYRRTSWGLAVSFVDALQPRPGDLDRRSAIVEFRSGYILRAQLEAEQAALGIGVIHSHPQGFGVSPSNLDDDMDVYFGKDFPAYSLAAPYVSLIVARGGDGKCRFSGRVNDGGKWLFVTELLTVGIELQREQSSLKTSMGGRNGEIFAAESDARESINRRLEQLVGEKGTMKLASAKVAIIGCSGTGSPMAHTLVRAGVRKFVLVDPQRFSPSNLERLHGSTAEDLDEEPLPFKVSIVRRLINDIAPDAQVTAIVGNALDEEVLDELLTCDLALGCTDTQHGRAFLGDLSSHYLLPSIDVGVRMRAKNGKLTEQVAEIAAYEPRQPCPFCQGRINQDALTDELITDGERNRRQNAAAEAEAKGLDGQQYWGGQMPREFTVGYQTATVANIAAGYAVGWLTGASLMPHRRFQFDPAMPCLGVVPVDGLHQPDCTCLQTTGMADQARADRSVSRPSHWSVARLLE